MKLTIASLLAAAGLSLGTASVAPPSEAAFWARIADWGAIYYDHRTGRAGYAWGYRNEADAKRAAQRDAQRKGIHPTKWYSVRNGCLSIYKDVQSTRYGWGRSESKAAARERARSECRAGGHICEERVWVCTRR